MRAGRPSAENITSTQVQLQPGSSAIEGKLRGSDMSRTAKRAQRDCSLQLTHLEPSGLAVLGSRFPERGPQLANKRRLVNWVWLGLDVR